MAYCLPIRVPCVALVSGISILVFALSTSFLLFFLQRDLSSLELTISLSFILFPFFLYSPLIEPGALNSQKLILSIILAHITTVLY